MLYLCSTLLKLVTVSDKSQVREKFCSSLMNCKRFPDKMFSSAMAVFSTFHIVDAKLRIFSLHSVNRKAFLLTFVIYGPVLCNRLYGLYNKHKCIT